jgi:uncharacterized protein (TIGR00255 family)
MIAASPCCARAMVMSFKMPQPVRSIAPLRSMTGFARVRRSLGDGELVISIKSLNHRGLDIQLHLPTAADPFENAMRTMVKSRLVRGHVEIRVSLPQSSASGKGVALNRTLLEQYLAAFREAAVSHGLDAQPDLNAALRIPGMFGDADESEPPAGAEEAVLNALAAALDELNGFRAREGAEIAAEMRRHNTEIAAGASEMERLRESASVAFQQRLAERLKELLNGAQIDPQRLAHEAAILAERSDIGEELARLKIHSAQLAGLLDAGGEAGKKIDFLLQEMNRETNTILSKTNGAGEAGLRITELAIAAKAGIEKIREQSLNLE